LEVRKPCRRGITRGSATLALGFFHNCFRESQKADGYSRLSYLEADGDRVNLFLGEKCRGEVRAQRQKQGYVFALSLLWASITTPPATGRLCSGHVLVGEYKQGNTILNLQYGKHSWLPSSFRPWPYSHCFPKWQQLVMLHPTA
jgi:catechol 2,3-dioxygenase-like lactoylglutathione lyase family enzyme